MDAKSPDTQKHTPGPWHRNIKPARKYAVIFAGRNTHVCVLDSIGKSDEEVEANCDLIAAAPELLKALKALYAIHIELDDAYAASGDISKASPELLAARAAIAKATQV